MLERREGRERGRGETYKGLIDSSSQPIEQKPGVEL